MMVSLLVQPVYDKCSIPEQISLTHEGIYGKVTCIVIYNHLRGLGPPGVQHLKDTTSRLTLMHCIESNNPTTVQTKSSKYTSSTGMLSVWILGTYMLQVSHTTDSLIAPQPPHHGHVRIIVSRGIVCVQVCILLTSRQYYMTTGPVTAIVH